MKQIQVTKMIKTIWSKSPWLLQALLVICIGFPTFFFVGREYHGGIYGWDAPISILFVLIIPFVLGYAARVCDED